MSDKSFRLDDRYTTREGRVALTGIQALVRLPMDQNRRDREAGLRVGTYVSGYQGSPLGELDKQYSRARELLEQHDIVFQPGINEDLAATAIYGSQLLEYFPHKKYDGVVGIWYGKSPGVDRSCDAFRHGQFLGTGRYGGALALAGDDPAAKSSTLPSDSTRAFHDMFFPVLYPADPGEVLSLGLHGIALSRFSGLWTALKVVTNVADGGAVLDIHPGMGAFKLPVVEINGRPFQPHRDIRLLPPYSLELERQICQERLLAVRAYARLNSLNRIMLQSGADTLGLVAAGKTWLDLMQALEMLGLGEADLKAAGIRLLKVSLPTPLEPESLLDFARGLDDILVIEEKRGFMETLIRSELYNLSARPSVYGKEDMDGRELFPMHGELGADIIAPRLAGYLERRLGRSDLKPRLEWLMDIGRRGYEPILPRTPYFCSGCPHNASTALPPGENHAGGGIGCHAMAAYMDRGISFLTHMGGEGAPWMGLAPFSEKEHLFQNVGDGTYYHSASKALEACIAAGVNMTFKLLYNSAVAMTGGQKVVGANSPLELARKLEAGGASEVVIVSDDVSRYGEIRYLDRFSVVPRERYDEVMQELRRVKGVSVIIYDQQCAAEKRRERKRGLQPTPRRRVYINPAVCEGCGDCGVKSNCLSVMPMETPFGRKTRIHQSSCNMDYTCLKGDCPAFMDVTLGPGTSRIKPPGQAGLYDTAAWSLTEPADKARCEKPYTALLVGIGGTGVVTVDALLVAAATMEGKYLVHLDQTGLSQKGGAVVSNYILCESPIVRSSAISSGEADLLLGFDILASTAAPNLNRFRPGRTRAVVNTRPTSTAATVTDAHVNFPPQDTLRERLNRFTTPRKNIYIDAEEASEALFGNSMHANTFLLGTAYQAGLLPLEAASIEQAIRLNEVAVEHNLEAFRWGRRAVAEPESLRAVLEGRHVDTAGLITPAAPGEDPAGEARERLRRFAPGRGVQALLALEELERQFGELSLGLFIGETGAVVYPRLAELMLYQGPELAGEYLEFVAQVARMENRSVPGRRELRQAVARWLFKLLAVKDEYEVARLWIQDETWTGVRASYQGRLRRRVYLLPPFLRRLGLKRKLRLGGWVMGLFGLLYRLRGLRGSVFDPFNSSAHRRWERGLADWYRNLIGELLLDLDAGNHSQAVEIAAVPDLIRGYEEIKEHSFAKALTRTGELLERFYRPAGKMPRAVAGD